MKDRKTKAMLALIWLGCLVLMGAAGVDDKGILGWLMWAVQAGALAGLAVALRHYYKQIRLNAIWEYRRNLMWAQYVKEHGLENGKTEE